MLVHYRQVEAVHCPVQMVIVSILQTTIVNYKLNRSDVKIVDFINVSSRTSLNQLKPVPSSRLPTIRQHFFQFFLFQNHLNLEVPCLLNVLLLGFRCLRLFGLLMDRRLLIMAGYGSEIMSPRMGLFIALLILRHYGRRMAECKFNLTYT